MRNTVTSVTLTDDISGGVAVETLSFAVEGQAYEIDLNKSNAAAFRKAVKPFMDAARVSRPQRGQKRLKRVETGVSYAAVREWARANGVKVSDRGRIPQGVVEQYRASGN